MEAKANMETKERVKICWLGRKYKKKYVCFIPITIDGMGRTVHRSLENLEKEAVQIVRAIRSAKPKIKCNLTELTVRRAIHKQSWWKHERCRNGKLC
jgi:hypothetical protein